MAFREVILQDKNFSLVFKQGTWLSGHHRYYGAKKAGRTDVKMYTGQIYTLTLTVNVYMKSAGKAERMFVGYTVHISRKKEVFILKKKIVFL